MSKHRLMLIDDDERITALIARVAMEADFEVCAASCMSDILASHDTFNPHLIALDIIMPEMDGFEVLKFLHQRNSTSRVLILSGQDEYRAMAARMGEGLDLRVIGALAKPFRLHELRLTLLEAKAMLLANSCEAA